MTAARRPASALALAARARRIARRRSRAARSSLCGCRAGHRLTPLVVAARARVAVLEVARRLLVCESRTRPQADVVLVGDLDHLDEAVVVRAVDPEARRSWTRASAVVEVCCCMTLSFGLSGLAGRPWPGVPPLLAGALRGGGLRLLGGLGCRRLRESRNSTLCAMTSSFWRRPFSPSHSSWCRRPSTAIRRPLAEVVGADLGLAAEARRRRRSPRRGPRRSCRGRAAPRGAAGRPWSRRARAASTSWVSRPIRCTAFTVVPPLRDPGVVDVARQRRPDGRAEPSDSEGKGAKRP